MGNKMSNPLSEENMEKVHRIIAEVLSRFSTMFVLHYKDAIITASKSTGTEKEATSGFRLPDCAVPDYLLRSGVMYKKGMNYTVK